MGYIALVYIFVLFLTAFSCGSSEKQTVHQNQDSVYQAMAEKDTLPEFTPVPPAPAPGTVHLKGKFIKTSSLKNDTLVNVTFEVVQILGYGSSTPPLAVQDTLEMTVSKKQEILLKDKEFTGVFSHGLTMAGHKDSTSTWHVVHIESEQDHK